MSRNRIPILIAAVALVAGLGAGAGVGGYAALSGDKTTTVVEQTPAVGTPAAATKSSSVGNVYEAARDGVVEITTTSTSAANGSPFPFGGDGGSRESRSQGSGFVYDSAGHVITNYHVVEGAKSISVTFADGSKYDASVVGSDPSIDLAVHKVDAPSSKLHPLALGDSSALAVGDGVVAIGAPFGLEETVTSGIVSALDRSISSATRYSISGAIQTDAAINHGNSGGPLLNMAGQVIGVTTQIESESGGNDGIGFAIPSNTVQSVVSRLAKGEKAVHPYLGVLIGSPSNGNGARVERVIGGSPAAKAGLKAGDVITAFGDDKIGSPDELTAAVATKQPGDNVQVTYRRKGDTHTVEVTLGTRPS